jgi:hypothetical protein
MRPDNAVNKIKDLMQVYEYVLVVDLDEEINEDDTQ